jgi:large subunit ribosomal protein L24e
VKYSRKLWSQTVEAMKKVEEIKKKRVGKFMAERWRKADEFQKDKDRREVKRDMALIRSPAAGLKKPKKGKVIVQEEGDDDEEVEVDTDEEGQEVAESSEGEEAMMEAN